MTRIPLRQVLHETLIAHPNGLKEYELVQILRALGIEPFAGSNLRDELTLFQVHFLLFHQLYLLQEWLREKQSADLAIHCLEIRLKPWPEGENPAEAEMIPFDPLRAYYLDASRLTTTTKAEVQVMLDWFWRRFVAHEGRAEALKLLDLASDASPETIKSRYRALAKRHHPDAGGDPERFRAIAEAFSCLTEH
nr:DnaJ-related protein [uncultured bacterium]